MSKRIKVDKPTKNDALNDPLTDFKTADEVLGFKSRIIFSEKAFNHLNEMITRSANESKETGCFFLGRESNEYTNQILIDDFSSDFLTVDATFENGAVDVNDTLDELSSSIKKNNYTCVFHYHTHVPFPGSYFEVPADQDLNAYEALASSPIVLNHNVSIFGMLATPSKKLDNFQLYTMLCQCNKNDRSKFDYYRFPNMYYVKDGIIYKIGSYKRTDAPRLSSGRKVNPNVEVQGIGYLPNSKTLIDDLLAGVYIDGTYRFSDDHVSMSFPSNDKVKLR